MFRTESVRKQWWSTILLISTTKNPDPSLRQAEHVAGLDMKYVCLE